MNDEKLLQRIVVDPKIRFGKPCVAGTRITVQGVLELLNEGLSFPAIMQDCYPELTVEDIQACIGYAIALVAAEDINLRAIPARGSCWIRTCTRPRPGS
ncbi:MAG: DUF433 domain-containing protein [Anaerolineae bacterium]